MKTIGVLALQGGVREHVTVLDKLGVKVQLVKRTEHLARIDGLVIPGGESSVIDRLSRIFEVREPIREAINDGMPVLGTCAGMIMLADRIENPSPAQQTFGGIDMTVRRNAFGTQTASFDARIPVKGVEGAVDASFIRAPIALDVGAAVEIIATCNEHIVGVRSGNCLALSFHPEVAGDPRVHAMFVRII